MAVQERFTLRNLYLYLVCLITLVIAIFSAVSLVRNIVELAYPGDNGWYAYEPLPAEPNAPGRPAESAADSQRRADRARESQRRESVLSLVGSGTTLLIVGPLYGYHWRKVQAEVRARTSQPAAGEPPVA